MKWKYILKRILIAIPTFFGITILAYFILNMAPGSPLDALLADPGITPAELERKRVALGLDQPVIIQYFTWLKQLLTGNLGFSYSTQRPVAAMILERLPATAILAASSIVLSLIVSIPLGIFAASRPNSGRDYFSGIRPGGSKDFLEVLQVALSPVTLHGLQKPILSRRS